MIATFRQVAKWYGNVIGLVDATVDIDSGVTGLLGPNGAGKSTFLKLLTGQLRPSQGTVRLMDVNPFIKTSVHARVGFLPEQDAFYENLTGRQFVVYLTSLFGFSGREAKRLSDAAIERVGLSGAARRKIRTYSKGMRQRIKLAQAIAHEPDVLILDEPLTGMDPVARRDIIDLVREWGAAGRAVIVSSHILHEVESMTSNVILLYQGRVRAWGGKDEIRGFLADYPHRIRIQSPRARELARMVMDLPRVEGVRIYDGGIRIETRSPDEFYEWLPRCVLEEGLPVEEVEAEDVGLDAIFRYLVK